MGRCRQGSASESSWDWARGRPGIGRGGSSIRGHLGPSPATCSEEAPPSQAAIDSPPGRGQPDAMRLVLQHNDEELVQLATRIPRDIARRLKEFCVRKDMHMQSFVRRALVEKLT